jgi:hypothetical protein
MEAPVAELSAFYRHKQQYAEYSTHAAFDTKIAQCTFSSSVNDYYKIRRENILRKDVKAYESVTRK